MRRIAWIFLFSGFFLLMAGSLMVTEPVSGEPQAPVMALTFDDGPSEFTEELALGLAERGVKATFFVLGQQVEQHPEALLLLSELGHEIGSHGYDHQKPFTSLSDEDLLRQLSSTATLVEEITGYPPVYVRPPYGTMNHGTAEKIPYAMMLWTIETRDWATLDSDSVRSVLLEQAEDGSVALMHDAYASTVEGALEAVDALLAEGWQFVTLSEYYDLCGIAPEPGQVYRGKRLADIP